MNTRINLKSRLKILGAGKTIKKNMSNIRKLFFILLSLMLGLTWQFNAFAQELDYADNSGKAAEIIKNSEQYQSFLALQKRIAEENGDRVRKFEVAVDGVNAEVINEDLRFVKNSPLKNPFIRTKDTRRTFELYNDFLLLDENGRIKFLVLNVKYKEEVKLVSEFFEYYDDELIGLSFKRNREFHVVLDFSEFKKLKFLSIKNMKVENIIFPIKVNLSLLNFF